MSVESWHVDRISVAPFDSEDDFGAAVYSATVRNVPARVEAWEGLVRGPDGQERNAEYRVQVTRAMKLRDRVWLPAEGDDDTNADDGRVPITIRRSRRKDGTGLLVEMFF